MITRQATRSIPPGLSKKLQEANGPPCRGLAIAPDGNIWTFNRGKIPVQVFTPQGKLVKYWGEGMFKNPHSVRFDNAGNLWIIDTQSQTVRKFTQDGKVLLTIGTPDQPGEDQTHMNQPNDVAFAANGDIYVSDGYGNDRVVVFDKNGKFVRAWGKLGAAPGEFSQPHSIALDSKGRVYVADRNNSRIHENGKEKPGDLNWVHTMAVAADGTIYFGDVQGKRAQKFTPVGLQSSN